MFIAAAAVSFCIGLFIGLSLFHTKRGRPRERDILCADSRTRLARDDALNVDSDVVSDWCTEQNCTQEMTPSTTEGRPPSQLSVRIPTPVACPELLHVQPRLARSNFQQLLQRWEKDPRVVLT